VSATSGTPQRIDRTHGHLVAAFPPLAPLPLGPLETVPGSHWHLGHDDHDRSRYSNLAVHTVAREARRKQLREW
jgi:hypothetical protein